MHISGANQAQHSQNDVLLDIHVVAEIQLQLASKWKLVEIYGSF